MSKRYNNNRDSGRGSMGLGIVLTDESRNVDFERAAAAAMGLARSSSNNSSNPDHHHIGYQEESIFTRLVSGISSFMSTTVHDDDDGDSTQNQQLQPKSRIQDMLESYYMAQNRQVPDWVYHPPIDPPISSSAATRPASIVVRPNNTVSRVSSRVSSSSNSNSVIVEEESVKGGIRELSAKPSSVSTGSVMRPFARLNISRLIRPSAQHTNNINDDADQVLAKSLTPVDVEGGIQEASETPLEATEPTSRSTSRLRRMWPVHLARVQSGDSATSGLGSPNLSEIPDPTAYPREILESSNSPEIPNVRLIDSANESSEESNLDSSDDHQSSYPLPQFALDSSRLTSSVNSSTNATPQMFSRSQSPFSIISKRRADPSFPRASSTRSNSNLQKRGEETKTSPHPLSRGNSGKWRTTTPAIKIKKTSSYKATRTPTQSSSSQQQQPRSKLSHESSPGLGSPPSPVTGIPIAAKSNNKLSSSLPTWVNPAKWRHKSPRKPPHDTTTTTAATDPHMLSTSPGIEQREQSGGLKTIEPTADISSDTSEQRQSRRTQSATPRPSRVKRLFHRKSIHE